MNKVIYSSSGSILYDEIMKILYDVTKFPWGYSRERGLMYMTSEKLPLKIALLSTPSWGGKGKYIGADIYLQNTSYHLHLWDDIIGTEIKKKLCTVLAKFPEYGDILTVIAAWQPSKEYTDLVNFSIEQNKLYPNASTEAEINPRDAWLDRCLILTPAFSIEY